MASRQLLVSAFRRVSHTPCFTVLPLSTSSRLSLAPVQLLLLSSSLRCNFHATPAPWMPVRRRRPAATAGATSTADEHGAHTTASDDEENEQGVPAKPIGIRHEAVTDLEQFRKASSALLDKLHAALTPLVPINTQAGFTFALLRGVEEDMGEYLLLDLGPVHGQYNIQVDLEQALVVLSSPISGQVCYVLSASTGEFCGLDDGHALEGLFVRDLIRQIIGVPQL